ncbi:hypothetical protein HSBAA_20200 [Vreelandella sulfidaeris]|uniref:Uncharacterized protein n=1 Tax=Vreelandella sulfidaeris TaxID=115553 RepID=A0A455UBW9_9GAMM|nr:hypothetical protein HSBAA_20200 [Halomonas sulfidaeris]
MATVPCACAYKAGGRGQESEEFERQMSSYAEHLSQQGQTVTQQLLPDVDHFSVLEHYLNNGCFVEWIKGFHG